MHIFNDSSLWRRREKYFSTLINCLSHSHHIFKRGWCFHFSIICLFSHEKSAASQKWMIENSVLWKTIKPSHYCSSINNHMCAHNECCQIWNEGSKKTQCVHKNWNIIAFASLIFFIRRTFYGAKDCDFDFDFGRKANFILTEKVFYYS